MYNFYLHNFVCYGIYEHVVVLNMVKDCSFHGPCDLSAYFPDVHTIM